MLIFVKILISLVLPFFLIGKGIAGFSKGIWEGLWIWIALLRSKNVTEFNYYMDKDAN